MKPKIESDDNFCCNGCILTEEGTDKIHLNRTFQTKTPRTKTNLTVKTYVCMHVLLKIGGFRDV